MIEAAHLLRTRLGEPGSGRVRYGAAMALWRSGALSDAVLEVYRIASAHDGENPADLMHERGLTMPDLPAPTPDTLIRALVTEADAYLADLPGPGVAEARAGIAEARGGDCLPVEAPTHPVVAAHLAAALEHVAQTHPALAAAIGAAAPHLHWQGYPDYDPALIGPGFVQGNAYAVMIGAQYAPIPAGDFDLGLFLLAPHVLYRDHCHPAPELYAPLTGPHGWRFAPDAPLVVKPAHVPVWNEPHQPHLTKVGPVPFLCLYAWTRDTQLPARVIPAEDWPALEALRL
ncbi:MAG: dimethylsulfonioproprionate lyase family protein [Gemmobacter sp.]